MSGRWETGEKLTQSSDVDLFRIKILREATAEMVCHNYSGEEDNVDADGGTGGGSIVIHKK